MAEVSPPVNAADLVLSGHEARLYDLQRVVAFGKFPAIPAILSGAMLRVADPRSKMNCRLVLDI